MTWINRDDDWKNVNSLFQRRFRCRCRNRILRNLRWLPVKCRDATLTFKCVTGQAPGYLTSMFITSDSVSGRITRNFQRLNIPLFKTVTGQKTFYYRSVSIWNKLDSSLKLYKNPASFKRALKNIPLNELLN